MFVNSNPQTTVASAGSALQNVLAGNVTLQRVKRSSQLNLEYTGGGLFFSGGQNNTVNIPPAENGTFQSLNITQSVRGRRWGLTLGDQVSYLPESPFGFSGYGGLTSYGLGQGGNYLASAPVLNPSVEPGQSILTRRSRRVGNVALGEVEYYAGPRSTITVTGVYGILDFLDPEFLDSDYWRFMTGYNYAATRKDTVSVSYARSGFGFDIPDHNVSNDDFMFGYGRKVTGRLAVQLSAGPQISRINSGPGISETRYLVNTFNSLTYLLERGRIRASFGRFSTAGSGVISGAQTNLATFSLGHELSRKLFGSFTVRYALNEPLQRQGLVGPRPDYRTLQGTVNISRELSRSMSIYFAYFVQHQDSSVPLCFDLNCGTNLVRHVVGAGFNWHGRPTRLD